jgi:CRP/FNR family transcriptional regulator, cyclic AMP receptor protein
LRRSRNENPVKKTEAQVRFLSLVDVLEPLSAEELEDLATRCPDIRLEKGQEFHRPQEHDEGLYLIKEGWVRVYKLGPRREQLTFDLINSGTVLTAQGLRGVHAQAMEPSAIAFLSRENLVYFIRRNPEVGLRLMDVLAERLRLMNERMADVVCKDVRARLAVLILHLVYSEGVVTHEGFEIPAHYTHEQLASMIGARRVAVTRAFKQLRDARALWVGRRRIHVRDLQILEGIADQERQ